MLRTKRVLPLGVFLLLGFAFLVRYGSLPGGTLTAQATGPEIWTNETGYLAGQTVAISGVRFAAGELVTFRVTHPGGGAEADAGHDPFTATADDGGNVTATWTLGDDSAGNEFVLSASGATAGTAPSKTFRRIARVRTNQYDYQPGETVLITGEGFRPQETVVVRVEHSNGVNDGAGHLPFEVPADADGNIWAAWFVAFDDSKDSIFRLTATGAASGVSATATFTDALVTALDDGGADDEPGQKDLNFLQIDYSSVTPNIAVVWGWDDTRWSGNNTGDACTLFDTDTDGFANYALCITVDQSGLYLATRVYSCGADSRTDRCAGPTLVGTRWYNGAVTGTIYSTGSASVDDVDPFGTTGRANNDCSEAPACLTYDTVANLTVSALDIGGAGGKLLNVCSYPSQEPNADPSDCIYEPNSGFLTIVKVATPDAGTAFAFTSSAPSAGGMSNWTINGSGSVQLISFAAGTYSLNEAIPAGWSLEGASCEVQSNPAAATGTPAALPVPGPASAGVSSFTIASGLETICTFTNVQQQPELTLVKSADPLTYDAAGDVIAYSYLVSNSGNVKLAGPVTIADDKTTATCPDVATVGNLDGYLDPAESITCTASYAVTQADLDAGSVTNTATASAGGTDSNESSATVTAEQAAKLTLQKSATPGTYSSAGEVIAYSFVLTNSGNVTLAAPFTVTDDKTSDETCPSSPTSLAPGDSITCTASYTIALGDLDAGSVKNTAQGHAFFGTTPVDSNYDDETVTAAQSPALSLDKTATPMTYDAVGAVISYSYLLTNTGNVTLSAPFTVTDDKATVTCPASPAALAPLATITCTASYTIAQADIDAGSIKNTAQGHAFFGTTPVDSNYDDVTVIAEQRPALDLQKKGTFNDANGDGRADVGETVTYNFIVTNTGNVTLNNVTVTDPLVTVSGGPITLAPGASDSTTFTGTLTLTQAQIDAGSVYNLATACSGPTCDDDDETVPLPQVPSLALDKDSATTLIDHAGQVVPYTFKVTNTGNVTLHGVVVTDPLVTPIACPASTLAPGETMTCTGSHAVTQEEMNSGGSLPNTATADSDESEPATDTHTIPITQTPAIDLVKTAALTLDPDTSGAPSPGDTITYSFKVTNTGNVTLNSLTVTDPLPGLSAIACAVSSLAPAAFTTCTATYVVTAADLAAGVINNTATASGLPPSGTAVTDTDDETVTVPRGWIVIQKETMPDGDSQAFGFTGSLGAFNLSDGQSYSSPALVPGLKTVAEIVPAGWDLVGITCADPSGGTTVAGGANIALAAGETVTCTFTNQKRGLVQVKKITNGSVHPELNITFTLFETKNNPLALDGDVPLESLSTFGDADGVLAFQTYLMPGATYTVCENPVPAGWTSQWQIGFMLNGTIVTPFNPDAALVPPQDLGVRCYNFAVLAGETAQFQVQNDYPGGAPRTIGYWKNWNTCTTGGQAETAAANGGMANGFFILDNVLPQVIGDASIATCADGARILGKLDLSGKNRASDAAYELASQLLAAQANLAAGAETCSAVQNATLAAQSLLGDIDFTGLGDYLGPKVKGPMLTVRATALSLAATLDYYNNGMLCPQ